MVHADVRHKYHIDVNLCCSRCSDKVATGRCMYNMSIIFVCRYINIGNGENTTVYFYCSPWPIYIYISIKIYILQTQTSLTLSRRK